MRDAQNRVSRPLYRIRGAFALSAAAVAFNDFGFAVAFDFDFVEALFGLHRYEKRVADFLRRETVKAVFAFEPARLYVVRKNFFSVELNFDSA